MPEIDGFDVCRQIIATQSAWFDLLRKKQEISKFKTYRRCPVVAVTAFMDDEVYNKGLSVGMKDIIAKPVSLE